MRQLKFRAWNGKNMVLPDLSDWDDFFILPDGDIGFMDEDTRPYSSHRFLGYRKDWEVMQFTGLKDKNGKEIYEGDIILNDMSEHSSFVSWDEILFSFISNEIESNTWVHLYEILEDINCYEVIGNIYENKDLLNK